MGKEINLMRNYPKTKRDLSQRVKEKTQEDKTVARKFAKDFFDGDRRCGYGGFYYNPKYWQNVIPDFQDYYKLNAQSKVLDIGCAKGFMLYDLVQLIPGISVQGVDISEYAIENAKDEIRDNLQVADARKLPFDDNSFDLVISITTLHNLEIDDMKIALKEIKRVSKKNAFITLDAYRNDEEKIAMETWNLTALTMMHTDQWKDFFSEINYNGDYYWFIP